MDKYAERRQLLDSFKDKPCARCGQTFPPYVMDFHHLDPSKKEFTIGKLVNSRNLDRITNEISKCILVCSNCHRAIHYELGED